MPASLPTDSGILGNSEVVHMAPKLAHQCARLERSEDADSNGTGEGFCKLCLS